MLRCIFSMVVALALTAPAGSQTLETRPPQPAPGVPRALANNEPTYLKLRNIKLGTETVRVTNLTLQREAGIFVFKSGVFQMVEPVNGKITAQSSPAKAASR